MDRDTFGQEPTIDTSLVSRPILIHVVRDPVITGSQRVALDILGDPALSKFRRIIISGSEAAASKQFLDEVQRLGIESVHIDRLRRDMGLHDVDAFIDLWRTLKALRPELVHTHSVKPFLLAGLAAMVLRVPRRIHTLHGISFHRFTPIVPRLVNFFIEQIGSLFYHRLVSVNAYFRKLFPLARLRGAIRVIPNGISLPRQVVQAALTESGEFPILFAGRLDDQKDPLFLLDVAELIESYWKSDLVPRFYLAGSGPLLEQVTAEIESRGLANKVILLGWVADLSDRYAAAKALFFPSRWEACPLVLIEAAMQGCPAVASNIAGVPELIRDGHNGLIFEQGNVAAACQCLARLASDETFRHELAERARSEAQGHDIGVMRDQYLDVYRGLGLAL